MLIDIKRSIIHGSIEIWATKLLKLLQEIETFCTKLQSKPFVPISLKPNTTDKIRNEQNKHEMKSSTPMPQKT